MIGRTPNPAILNAHYQIHPNSCIPMIIEYIMKEEGILPLTFFGFQQTQGFHLNPHWITLANTAPLTFSGDISHSSNPNRFFKLMDRELAADRFVYLSLQNQGGVGWHMYAIASREEDGLYTLVTSNFPHQHSWTIRMDLRNTIPHMKGVDLQTYH